MTVTKKDVRLIDRIAQRHRSFASAPWRAAWDGAGIYPYPTNGPAARVAVASAWTGDQVKPLGDYTDIGDGDRTDGKIPAEAKHNVWYPVVPATTDAVAQTIPEAVFAYDPDGGTWEEQGWELAGGSTAPMPTSHIVDIPAGQALVIKTTGVLPALVDTANQRYIISARVRGVLAGTVSWRLRGNAGIGTQHDFYLYSTPTEWILQDQLTAPGNQLPISGENHDVCAVLDWSGLKMRAYSRDQQVANVLAMQPGIAITDTHAEFAVFGPQVVDVRGFVIGIVAVDPVPVT